MSFFKGFVPRIGRETFPPGLYERSANALPQREKNEFPRIYECYEYYEYCVGRLFHLCTIHAGCDPQRLARRLAIGPAVMHSARGAFSALGLVPVCGPYTRANLRCGPPLTGPAAMQSRGRRSARQRRRRDLVLLLLPCLSSLSADRPARETAHRKRSGACIFSLRQLYLCVCRPFEGGIA